MAQVSSLTDKMLQQGPVVSLELAGIETVVKAGPTG
jgi:hypothetical protein